MDARMELPLRSFTVRNSPSGMYAECFGENCDWHGAIEDCWHRPEDPDALMCGSCLRPIASVWHASTVSEKP